MITTRHLMIGLIVVVAAVYALAIPNTLDMLFTDPETIDRSRKLSLAGFYIFGKVSFVAALWWLFVRGQR